MSASNSSSHRPPTGHAVISGWQHRFSSYDICQRVPVCNFAFWCSTGTSWYRFHARHYSILIICALSEKKKNKK